MKIVKILDTTLRDGEQSPGNSMNTAEKLQMARQLARLNVDIIEAGFAIASKDDFNAIKTIAGEVEGPIICSLARATDQDIATAWDAIKEAPKKRIHTFHSTSKIHLTHQHNGMSQKEALKISTEAVLLAKSFTEDVQFSLMDATRTDINYICEVVEAVIAAGALTVNIPDTVGYSIPTEFGEMIRIIFQRVKNINEAVIAVHCHNDLGLATANSLSAVLNGAGQIECTVNGIGERAGNCSLEEVVMAMRTRGDIFGADTGITTEEIISSSRLLTKITGSSVQPNKAIVGANAFAHEAGIHQDGLLKDKSTYEIITPETVGLNKTKLIFGKHSGRKAIKARFSELGFELEKDVFEEAFRIFKDLADKRKELFDDDLVMVVLEATKSVPEKYKLIDCKVGIKMNGIIPIAEVTIEVDGEIKAGVESGVGQVDAIFNAVKTIIETKSVVSRRYELTPISEGTESLAEISITLKENGYSATGIGANSDIIIASAKSIVDALNRLEAYAKVEKIKIMNN